MSVSKILCCCGSGLGSSMLVRMNVDKVLNKLDIRGITVENSSISEATEGNADLFIVGLDLADFVASLPNVIVLNNIMSLEELETKLKEKL
ncbi:MAG: PTS sugar transporter subunit IIB [Culicoidibacterales bacterium]